MTFDPSTLNFVQLQALIHGNFMWEYDQNPYPRLSALSPLISPYFSYQILLERAKMGSCARKQWRIRMRMLGHKWNQISQLFLQRFVHSMRTHCHAVITLNGNKTCFKGTIFSIISCDFWFWPPARFGDSQESYYQPMLFQALESVQKWSFFKRK